MRILSIETSCDDTGITAFEVKGGATNAEFKVLADNLASQVNIHNQYGGVYPMLAKREHIKNLPIVLEKTLREAKLDKKKRPVDLICVTSGPGLPPSLWAGITFAQELAKKWGVPLQPTNHMEGHVLSPFGKHKGKFKITKLKAPILSLLVSGGHSQLVLVKERRMSSRGGSVLGGDYEIIGETQDDAVGEAFDKVARMLGLPYPGGPHISKLAEEARLTGKQVTSESRSAAGARTKQFSSKKIASNEKPGFSVSLPRPMLYTKDFNFSFSGLKTSVLYLLKKLGTIDDDTRRAIALEFENAAIECLVYKTAKAIEKYKIKTLIVAGGVAANKHLRNEIKKVTGKKIKLLLPTHELARDNSVMIGIAGYLNFMKNKRKTPRPESIKAEGRMRL